ncbi:hypothetical protein BFP72_09245 [Reichenbachiella sp. 5M10]|uniref:hypothetical protein n=1 Tax=Reichenbachiella sp. 5M10 TaxID=1889772 RepID=UPI000C14913A|nr:hypothetical protein [Reichenbachiella sp. 5M10]PIB35563.1 hypothetical protein BFP72_09245 [Reichenbachiella sp. 5M10]
MNKQKFIELVRTTERGSVAEAKELNKLVHEYPFFQNGHVLLAKLSKQLGLPNAQKLTSTAAVYATNRAVFKDIMTSAEKPVKPTTSTPKSPTPPPQAPAVAKSNLDQFIQEVYANLENLKSSRENYLAYEKEHPEEIVILPVTHKEHEEDTYEKLKRQVADEVEAEEAKDLPNIATETSPEPFLEKESETKEASTKETILEEELDQIEAAIDSKVAEVTGIDTKQPKQEKTVNPTPEVAEAKDTPPSTPTDQKKDSSAPDIEDLDDQMADLESQIAHITPPEKQKEVEEPEKAESPAPKTTIKADKLPDLPIMDDDSDSPIVDEDVIELDQETIYNFNSIPEPKELPEEFKSKKTATPSPSPEEQKTEEVSEEVKEEMISSEELTEIVDQVSEEVENMDTTGLPEDVSSEVAQQLEEKEKPSQVEKTSNEEKSSTNKEAKVATTPPKKEQSIRVEIDEEELNEELDLSKDDSETELNQYDEERKTLKLVPGASKGDKKFRLSIMKRPHNFTKPKKEDKETATKVKATSEVSKTAPSVEEKKAPTTKTAKTTAKPKASKAATTKAKAETKKASKKTAATKKKTTTTKTTKPKKEAKEPEEEPENKLKSSPKFRVSASIKTSKKLTSKKPPKDKKTPDDEEVKKKEPKLNTEKIPKDLQDSLIDSFIQTNPSIEVSRDQKDKPVSNEDLSIHSSIFPDKLVTENLATILTEQGKTERAIEIYQKLILKNPQKKAYFASQIEKLKKL